jgi:hypothetical protein
MRLAVHDLGIDFLVLLSTALLVVFPAFFFYLYKFISIVAREAAWAERPETEIAGLFIFSLVPIAIAYHLAHYLSYLLVAGQLIIPLASDPFGWGWDIFGTAGYKTNISVIGAKFVWYAAVTAVILGHVVAVGVAHIVALRAFKTRRAAIQSQYPLLVLMIGYTVMSLWILSQPIVENPDYVSFREPSGSLVLTPEAKGEICLDMAAGDEIQYSFGSKRPVDFDVHFHDGFKMQFPVKVNAILEISDRFVADVDRSYCLMWANRSDTATTLIYQVSRPGE